jgi:hypothetical protein
MEFTESTIANWVHRLGFDFKIRKKSIYIDGHERADVVKDRKDFIELFERLKPDCELFDFETLTNIENLDAKWYILSQDEKIHHSNERQSR